MPGTIGGLLAFPVVYLVSAWPLGWAAALVLGMCVAGIWICGAAGRLLGKHDHGSIVWDEICGALIAMLAVPADWRWWFAAFVVFRFFDIVKPWPISWLDRNVSGGAGVMLDDLAAGIMAGTLLASARLLFLGA
jgi:phosphatidylglycerophosphatase A